MPAKCPCSPENVCSAVIGGSLDEVKGLFSTSPTHLLTKEAIHDPESRRTEFQAVIYLDSVSEFHFISLILMGWVFFFFAF